MTAPSILNRRAATPRPWTWEEHELSEGFSCVVYDEHGQKLADHLGQGQAALIAAAPSLLEAAREGLICAEADVEGRKNEIEEFGGNFETDTVLTVYRERRDLIRAAITRATAQSPDSGGEG